MDARRFDSLARGIARVGDRRSIIRALALSAGAAVTFANASSAGALDATDSGVGGSDGTGTCPPTRRPPKRVAGAPPFPVFLVSGTCAEQDGDVRFNLIDAGAEEAGEERDGSGSAIAIVHSRTTIDVRVRDLLASPHALIVEAGGASNELIACGDVGGVFIDGSLAFGLGERNGSGYAGAATLTEADGQTRVAVYVAQDLFELVDAWEGAIVVTTIDVNLRAAPSEQAEIVAVLGDGTALTVTGPAVGAWLPVVNEATGETGYVNAAYVEVL